MCRPPHENIARCGDRGPARRPVVLGGVKHQCYVHIYYKHQRRTATAQDTEEVGSKSDERHSLPVRVVGRVLTSASLLVWSIRFFGAFRSLFGFRTCLALDEVMISLLQWRVNCEILLPKRCGGGCPSVRGSRLLLACLDGSPMYAAGYYDTFRACCSYCFGRSAIWIARGRVRPCFPLATSPILYSHDISRLGLHVLNILIN